MKRLRILHDAQLEVDEAVAYYNQRGVNLGLRFLVALDSAKDKIAASPKMWPLFKRSKNRFFRLKRFPYLVVYREFDDVIVIVAVAHERRRANYWRRRKLQ